MKKTTQITVDPRAIAFFRTHGGYVNPKDAEENAQKLAYAEAYAKKAGWRCEWQDDPEPYDMGDAETEAPKEVLGCVLKDAKGRHSASIWGIGDPSNDYVRIIEAGLAIEALADIRRFEAHKRALRDRLHDTRAFLLSKCFDGTWTHHDLATYTRAVIALDRATR